MHWSYVSRSSSLAYQEQLHVSLEGETNNIKLQLREKLLRLEHIGSAPWFQPEYNNIQLQ